MPRRTRMYLPGLPHRVVQRGHNRDISVGYLSMAGGLLNMLRTKSL
jgi:hypothetical protein